MTAESLRVAALKATTITIETAKIEGSLRVIHDLGGKRAVMAAVAAATQRVVRAHMNDNDGWVA